MGAKILLFLSLSVPLALGQPAITSVVNAASNTTLVSPGCWIAVYGTQFAGAEENAATVPLPKLLGGVSVSVDGLSAPLLYASPTQINALIPFETVVTTTRSVPVVVTTTKGGSVPFLIYLSDRAPAIFTRNGVGTGRPHIFDPNFRPVDQVGEGDVVVLYAAGLGPTSPPAGSDTGGSAVEPYNRTTAAVDVYIGENKADVLFAGLAPGYPGVYQLNVRVHDPWTDRLYLRLTGWQSNIVDVDIPQRSDVANITGAIDTIYPDPALPSVFAGAVAWSQAYHGAGFNVRFDILPAARPFASLLPVK